MIASKATSRPRSVPAPIGGWNARDSLADMPPTDAVTLTNWFPLTTECTLRLGHTQFATGLPGQVETLMPYYGGMTSELFAIADGEIYNITAGGAVGAPDVTGLTSSRWQWCNISTAGGNFLYAANGTDEPELYDGSTWTAITGVSTPAITGVTTTDLDTPILFKTRLFFLETGTLKTWYLPSNSIGGAANAVDISAVAKLGGHIVSHATWTLDAGQGVDDYYVIVTSRGEVVVYQGTDPSSVNSWALKGVWNLGLPVGRRCLYKLAGDLLYISQDGLIPLAGALQSSRVNPRVALTDKIQYATSQSISIYGDNFGWECLHFPRENMLIFNVPVEEGDNQQQYVMNTISKSWCNFTGWHANTWVLYGENPYFGGDGFVGQAWNTYSDNGTNIDGQATQAFSPFGAPGVLKRFTMIRPIFRSNGVPALNGTVNIDFNISLDVAPLSFSPVEYAVWDVDAWDDGLWGSGLNVLQNWQGVQGIGYYAAPQINLASQGIDTRWVSTDVVYEVGAIL